MGFQLGGPDPTPLTKTQPGEKKNETFSLKKNGKNLDIVLSKRKVDQVNHPYPLDASLGRPNSLPADPNSPGLVEDGLGLRGAEATGGEHQRLEVRRDSCLNLTEPLGVKRTPPVVKRACGLTLVFMSVFAPFACFFFQGLKSNF